MPELIPGFGVIAQGAVILIAFSFLVFIHELGHYLAARFVGVRVESFYIGIPIYGMALRRTWHGTTYGIGLLPLGGFVKLVGQSDDPRGMGATEDPDDLNAKPVWGRALIFSAGVIMNLIFGFILLVWANLHGIPFVPAVLGDLDPNGAAAIHGLREGDTVVALNGRPVRSFEDLTGDVAIAGANNEHIIDIERPNPDGSRTPMTFRILGQPTQAFRGNLVSIGSFAPESNLVGGVAAQADFREVAARINPGDRVVAVAGVPLLDNQGGRANLLVEEWPENRVRLDILRPGATMPESVDIPLETFGNWDLGTRHAILLGSVIAGGAAEAAGLAAGDAIVAAAVGDGAPVRFRFDAAQFTQFIRDSARQPVRLALERGGARLEVFVEPAATPGSLDFGADGDTHLGATVEKRPASEADNAPVRFVVDEVFSGGAAYGLLLPGDVLVELNRVPIDPARPVGVQVLEAGTAELRLYVKRAGPGGLSAIRPADLPLDSLDNLEQVRLKARFDPNNRRPMVGITSFPGPVVTVEPGSVAAKRLGTETTLLGAQLWGMFLSPDLKVTTLVLDFPNAADMTKRYGPGRRRLLLATPDSVMADPVGAGLKRQLPIRFQTARDTRPLPLGEAIAMSGRQWVHLSLTVYRTIGKLINRDIELKAMGGPVQLFRIIKVADDRGFGYLLYVVALISINLGICNLLPLPVLDGGHLMFLCYEGITGRKPGDTFLLFAQWAGLVFLLGVMLTVTMYDLADWLRF